MRRKRMKRDYTKFSDYEGEGGEQYAAEYPVAKPAEYEWLKTVASEEGGPICELACGHGRLSLPLARLGYTVVGMDKSTTLIELATQAVLQESESVQSHTSFVVGDLRDFDLGQEFQYIFIFFGGFFFLDQPQDRLSCLRCAANHLLPGGLLGIEDPNVNSESVSRREMEWLFSEAGLELEAALRAHHFPLDYADPDEPALLYRVRKGTG